MKVSIYQVVPELDEKGILFRDLACAVKAGDGRIPSEIYECIYSGELPVTDPEQVFVMCNCEHPEGYKGHNVVNLSRHYPIIPTGNNSKNLIKHLTSTPKNVAAQLIINFDCEAEK